MATIRQERIEKLVKQELSTLFQRESKSLFEGAFITVTQVRISPDLSVAKTYLSLFMVKDKEAALELVKSQTNVIRKHLGNALGKSMRKIPELIFYIDDSLDYAENIDSLLKK